MKIVKILLLLFLLNACQDSQEYRPVSNEIKDTSFNISGTTLVILGTIQDAGSPHIACEKDCCRDLFLHPDKDRKVVSLGVIDPKYGKKYIFEATPDFTTQVKILKNYAHFSDKKTPDAVFLTHAHIGHYTGLMYLGKEAMNAKSIPVFAMPRMTNFLTKNGPWRQLVSQKNIAIQTMYTDEKIQLTPNLQVIPFEVPHRDEYSETVGYTIIGPQKSALFIPDIDKWEKWEIAIIDAIAKVDYAFLDATFYDAEEINNRDVSEIPHPFIIESMAKFKNLPAKEKSKIHFIHFNHTNPVINLKSKQAQKVIQNGFNIAQIYDTFEL